MVCPGLAKSCSFHSPQGHSHSKPLYFGATGRDQNREISRVRSVGASEQGGNKVHSEVLDVSSLHIPPIGNLFTIAPNRGV